MIDAAGMVVLGPSYGTEQRDAMKKIKDDLLEERRQVDLNKSVLMAELKAPMPGPTTLSQHELPVPATSNHRSRTGQAQTYW